MKVYRSESPIVDVLSAALSTAYRRRQLYLTAVRDGDKTDLAELREELIEAMHVARDFIDHTLQTLISPQDVVIVSLIDAMGRVQFDDEPTDDEELTRSLQPPVVAESVVDLN